MGLQKRMTTLIPTVFATVTALAIVVQVLGAQTTIDSSAIGGQYHSTAGCSCAGIAAQYFCAYANPDCTGTNSFWACGADPTGSKHCHDSGGPGPCVAGPQPPQGFDCRSVHSQFCQI
jgi:hypothetical protein